MSMDYIPTELLFDILTRLPVKTLLRCTSVSKSWHSLITSPSFITTHLNNQRNLNNKTPFLLLGHCTKVGKYLWKDHFSLRFDNETFDEFADLDFPDIISEEANQDFWIVGTCDGLVCLSCSDIIALWNPSLRKSLILPKPLLQSHGLIPRDIRLCIGFGIHPVTNDYKIVRLTYLRSDRVLVPPEVELFELSTGSWRIINAGNFSYVAPIDARQAFLNGVVHWAGHKPKYISNKSGSSFRTVIMSFDMRNDALGFVKAPACVQQHWHWSMRVTIFGESLSFSYFGVDNYCCVWVMNEYGIEGSWTKQFNIDLGGNFGRPIFFKENGDILLERCATTYCGVQLVSYDPKSKLIKNLNVHGIPCSFYVDTYNESLVLTRGLNEVLGDWKILVMQLLAGQHPFCLERKMRLRGRVQ